MQLGSCEAINELIPAAEVLKLQFVGLFHHDVLMLVDLLRWKFKSFSTELMSMGTFGGYTWVFAGLAGGLHSLVDDRCSVWSFSWSLNRLLLHSGVVCIRRGEEGMRNMCIVTTVKFSF